LKKVGTEGGWKGPKYEINKDPDCFDIFDEELLRRLQYPAKDWGSKKLGYGPWAEDK
jgi:hypothetical protein